MENICESSGGDIGSCVHSVCLCCGIGRGGGLSHLVVKAADLQEQSDLTI